MPNTETITVWRSASGEIFVAWYERQTSTIYLNDPDNIQALADRIGTTIEKIRVAIKTYEVQEETRQKKIQAQRDAGEWWA